MAIIRDFKGMPHFLDNPPEPVEPVELEEVSVSDDGRVDVTSDGVKVTTLADGSVIIGDDTDTSDELDSKNGFYDDLSGKISDSALSMIALDLIDGIDSDIRSRQSMIESYNKGLDLLGLRQEDRSGRRFRKNVSTVRHPVLLEAVVDFQSGFRGEMLPAEGPVKVAVEGGDSERGENQMAKQLEDDMNYYLTNTATEYYPDTDRGAFYLGYGGTLYKKVYRCPIRKRPVSECIYLTDLIVNESATDLMNALRVTHKIEMSQSQMRRMQLAGVYRDVSLVTPTVSNDTTKSKEKSIIGVLRAGNRPKDIPFTVYECYCELVPSEYGFAERGAPDGMALPYRVTLEKDSMAVLDIRRAWREDDKLYLKRLPFIKYGLVPGMGFLDYGFLHLIGNQTMALTAIWRILVDAGMFSNFPGGVRVKGTRQTTNEIQPGPGEWPEIDTGPVDDIRKALMPLPYKEPSAVFIQLAEIIANGTQRLGGAVKLEVGEGRQNVPVGTIMAMIEQQTKTMAACHKRLHTAQKEELAKLKELFEEDPEALFASNPKARKWSGAELKDMNLVPASDPNVPAQMHRIMQATALIQLADTHPDIYNKIEVHKRALKVMGIGDASDIMNTPSTMDPPIPDPRILANMGQMKIKQQEIGIKQQQQQREAADRVAQVSMEQQKMAFEREEAQKERESRERVAMINQETAKIKAHHDTLNAVADREHKAGLAAHDRVHDLVTGMLNKPTITGE